jgi:hypothetical protein
MSIQVEMGSVRTQLMRALVINSNLHSLAVTIDGQVRRDTYRFRPVRYWSMIDFQNTIVFLKSRSSGRTTLQETQQGNAFLRTTPIRNNAQAVITERGGQGGKSIGGNFFESQIPSALL